jgi:anhydro-N-acetylmuramic acid kinase
VDRARLDVFAAHPFFAAAPPKSLDRNEFAHVDLTGLTTADGAATLTAFTVETIAAAAGRLPRVASTFIVCGGGARNPTLMRWLAARLSPAQVLTADAVGWSGDAIEAQAFGYLAARHMRGLPITFPGTTGIPRPMPGGILAEP